MRKLTKQQQRIVEILAQGLPIKSYCTEAIHRCGYGLLAFGDYPKNLRRS